MDLLNLTQEIILSLVKDKDSVAVKEFPSENEDEVLMEVLISESDIPRVIGKSGKLINSVRTIVQASSYLKDNKKVKINVDSI